VYSTSGMKFSHGLLADVCKAAMSWRAEVHTLRFELSVQCTAALCFFSRSPLDCGNRMASYPWLLVSVGYTIEKVMSTISDSVRVFLFCIDSLAFSSGRESLTASESNLSRNRFESPALCFSCFPPYRWSHCVYRRQLHHQ
jgi:hypothetical protein